MAKIVVSAWSGSKREVHFVGYNRGHTACFIRNEQNSRTAIALRLPRLFQISFHQNPIGERGSPPVEISRTALHLPACFASRKETEAFGDPNSNEMLCASQFGHDLWKAATCHKCWLEPKHDKELSKLLRDELKHLRRRHKIREREIAARIAALPPGETERIKELRNMLRGEFTACAPGTSGLEYISIFDTTLEMVRGGWGNLRERLLAREWAEHHGLNLKTIPIEAAAFRAWLERLAYNARLTTTDLSTRTVETGVGLQLYPNQWEILEAAIQYEIRFADGSRCWLEDFEERAITDPQEVEDFDCLEQAVEIASDEKMTLVEVCHSLPVKWKGESRPMGKKGLQKLCEKAGVAFKFPMRRSIVQKLDTRRKRQRRERNERLQRHAAQARERNRS